jgi:S-methylmethionine-dependent homocysteine/selenocysteine methylase
METTLLFENGIDLPHFAAFPLLDDSEGLRALRGYYESYTAIAQEHDVGIVLDTPTWRANADWGALLGYSADALADVNRRGVALLEELRDSNPDTTLVISGCIGPRGDGYVVEDAMSPDQARSYHALQISTFAGTNADLVSALTLNYAEEAIGIARAARDAGIPCVISFTVETDGRLPSGQELRDAVGEVDEATGSSVAYFMINCAHPTHFRNTLQGGAWTQRVRGLRANASRRSHQELNDAPDLDDGDPIELGGEYQDLLRRHPQINVLGGCCGTDHRHLECIALACREVKRAA